MKALTGVRLLRPICVVLPAVQYSPNDVLEPRQESMLSDSNFGSGSDSDEDSDWDRFSSGEASSLNTAETPRASSQAQAAEARKKETSLFGVGDKRRAAPLK